MSRIGRKPIVVPSGVEIKIADGAVLIKGKNGELKLTPHSAMKIAFDAGSRHLTVSRARRSAAEPRSARTDPQPAQ